MNEFVRTAGQPHLPGCSPLPPWSRSLIFLRNNDIVRFDSPALTIGAYTAELKAEFDQLYQEAAAHDVDQHA